ncbi:MAG: cell division protein ZipA [Pseudohongiellaceae bacterium]|jgi:cell division protein ZipA
MELGARDWLMIVGVLLILVVIFDGIRRMRNDRRGKIRISLNKNFVNSSGDSVETFSTELPGGPRVVGRKEQQRQEQKAQQLTQNQPDEPAPQDQQDDLQLDEDVPMLMESITASEFSDHDVVADVLMMDDHGTGTDHAVVEDVANELVTDDNEPLPDPWQEEPVQQQLEAFQDAEQKPINPNNQEVIIINVMAKNKPFSGDDLLHILLACDCRFGDMNIFHRYENASGKGPVQFSVVNSVEPGTFDLDNISGLSTPGICFFVKVPGPQNPIQAFDYMVETAQCLVKNLNGELRDETHSAMTSQTLEHFRNRIREIERKQLTHA